MTNHHVGADTLHKISSAGHDYYKTGFWAKTHAEEQRSPDLELNVLQSIEDVTSRVNAAVKPEMSSAEAFVARRGVTSTIEKESFDKTGLRSDVVTLYQGGQYHLYRYKKYTDIRLVFAPEFEIAFFGGDPDNFEYPRYDLDICLFRAYEGDKPAKIDHFLKWSKAGAVDGELVFVSGHPGKTDRLNTMAALKYIRDVQADLRCSTCSAPEGNHAAAIRGTQRRTGTHREGRPVRGPELPQGILWADCRPAGSGSHGPKEAAEQAHSRAKFESDTQKKKAGGDPWDKIEKTQQIRREIGVQYNVLEGGRGFTSTFFSIARTLVRLAEENEKPNRERLPEYGDAARASLELQLYSTAPIYAELELAKLGDSLGYLLEKLGGDNPLAQKVMDGKNPADRAAELIGRTKLKDVDERKRIAAGGRKMIAESNDPFIVLARLVDSDSRAIRKKLEEQVVETERQAYAQISRTQFEMLGTSTYPDATFTLRLSYGTIKGYEDNGKNVEPLTTMGGAFQHADRHGNKFPWRCRAKLAQTQERHRSENALQLRLHLRHHRRKFGQPGDQPRG